MSDDADITIDEGTDSSSVDISPVVYFNGKMREHLEAIPENYRVISETELIDLVSPTLTDWAMRQSFHKLTTRARNLGEIHIPASKVFESLMDKANFYQKYLTNPKKAAFMSRPIIEHKEMYEALHNIGMQKLYTWVQTVQLDDPKNLSQLTKIVQLAADRAHGQVAQQMNINSRNLNVEIQAGKQTTIPANAEDLQKKLTEMQAKLLEGPKDVTPTEV